MTHLRKDHEHGLYEQCELEANAESEQQTGNVRKEPEVYHPDKQASQ